MPPNGERGRYIYIYIYWLRNLLQLFLATGLFCEEEGVKSYGFSCGGELQAEGCHPRWSKLSQCVDLCSASHTRPCNSALFSTMRLGTQFHFSSGASHVLFWDSKMLLQSLQNSMKHMQTECRERRQELHLDADAASVISG